eukprot:scaffold1506_cov179-Amphora_coffeaeformis.AAC.1
MGQRRSNVLPADRGGGKNNFDGSEDGHVPNLRKVHVPAVFFRGGSCLPRSHLSVTSDRRYINWRMS